MKLKVRASYILSSALLALSTAAQSQDLDKAEKALVMISKFANDICNKPDLKGKTSSVEVQGKAKAEVSKLVKQLADLQVEGAAKFANAEYEGLLQKDLLPALQNSTKCKEKIYNDLKDRFLPKPVSQGPVKGTAIIRDGFVAYQQSGFRFSSTSVVSWDSEAADILAAKPPGAALTGFFLPYDSAPYKHAKLDRNAASGIRKVSGESLESIKECPSGGYMHHWFQPQLNAVYCVRTRSGRAYAVIRVDSLDEDRIGFDFLYQPDGSNRF